MALIVNTNIRNDIKNGYLAEATQIKGGYCTVSTTTQRDNLSSAVAESGCLCYVTGTSKYYRWNNTTSVWDEVSFGGTGTVKTITLNSTKLDPVDGNITIATTNGIESSSNTIKLKDDFYNYLDETAYDYPETTIFDIYDNSETPVKLSNEQEIDGSITVGQIEHSETNVANINGNLTFTNGDYNQNITASDTKIQVSLSSAQSVTTDTAFVLKGKNSKYQDFTFTYQIKFYNYAYYSTNQTGTVPTSDLTKSSKISDFMETGQSISYTSGDYIYLYENYSGDGTNLKVQQKVLDNWADVNTSDYSVSTVTITKSTGTTASYKCYKIGVFNNSGTAIFRLA